VSWLEARLVDREAQLLDIGEVLAVRVGLEGHVQRL
jgi:hypothetical protein